MSTNSIAGGDIRRTRTPSSWRSTPGVEQLVLFHHRPERTDDEVDRCVAACRAIVAARGGTLTITAAAEGMTLDV